MKDLDTTILSYNFSWLGHAVLSSVIYIFISSASRPEVTVECCPTWHLEARTPWPTVTLSGARLWLTVTLWVPEYILFLNDYAEFFRFSHESYLHLQHRYLPVYAGASCNHFVYTAGTSGSIKYQYTTQSELSKRKRKVTIYQNKYLRRKVYAFLRRRLWIHTNTHTHTHIYI